MKKACLYISFDTYLCENKIFAERNVLNNHESTTHFSLLKKAFEKHGYDLSTHDINKPEDSEIIIYFSLPNKLPIQNHTHSYLLRFECEVINPHEWKEENLTQFKKVFTWNDECIKNNPKKYIKFNFPQTIPANIKTGIKHKDKFCALIAGNKFSNHPLELYSKRVEAIRWFEKNHPNEFDLYGIGWENGIQKKAPKMLQRFAKLKPFQKYFIDYFPSYKGKIASKRETLEKYKYSICYENAKDISGYITEKIFDCFFAGCIPIYWGANNITDHIPSKCFIDKRNFSTYEELYKYLVNLSDRDYTNYQNAIVEYIASKNVVSFDYRNFVKVILKGTLN